MFSFHSRDSARLIPFLVDHFLVRVDSVVLRALNRRDYLPNVGAILIDKDTATLAVKAT